MAEQRTPDRDRQQDSQIDALARSATSSTRRRLARRGVSLVECLILLALLGLGVIAGVRAIHQGIASVADTEARAIAALTPVRGGGSEGRPAPQPPEPEPEPEPSPPEEEEDDDGGFWGDALDFAIDLTPIGDVQTLLDPNASVFDKVLSGVSLATSVIPGVGQAVKGATVAIKAVKAVDNAADVAKAADNAGDVVKAGERAEDVADSADDVPLAAGGRRRQADEPEAEDCPDGVCRNGTCFVAGTPVHTEHGLRPIEEVRPGERVWSRDEVTGEQTLRRVVQTFVKTQRAILRLELEDDAGRVEPLRVTPPHLFWTGRGWIAAADLELTDQVMLRAGTWASVASSESLREGATVYNFEVADFHTYFVGDAGAWVHNESANQCPENESGWVPGRNDQDWRGGQGTYREAVDEAFRRTGLPREEFEVKSWARDGYGKSQPTEWVHPSGANVNVDDPTIVPTGEGPQHPHVGWQSGGKRGSGGAQRGHILLDDVPVTRPGLNVKKGAR